MIDITAPVGTFADPHDLVTRAAALLMAVEGVPGIDMFRQNTAAFLHELPPTGMADTTGDHHHVRVQVLTNAGALQRDQQLAAVARLTDLVVEAAADPSLRDRTWVLLTEAAPGGWGLWGHAHTNDELVAAARARMSA